MYFMLKSNVMFRDYNYFGYLTDNRNFGYRKVNEEKDDIGDKILSESGAVFLSVLNKKPKYIKEIVNEIKKKYSDIDTGIILNDIYELYNMLENEGFLISGKTKNTCKKKDWKFKYKKYEPKVVSSNITSENNLLIKETQEYFNEIFNNEPQLTSIHIEITSKCNEKCIHCYIPHKNKCNDMQPDILYAILKQCRDMNILHVTISGGEPFLHENFCEILLKCQEYDLSVNVLSNLSLLNARILEVMKNYPLLCVQVSLYSMNSEVHDSITQMVGSYKKTIRAIMKLIKNNIPLQISCPILKQNMNSYKEVINWAKKYNIHVGSDFLIIGRYDHSIENLNNRLSIHEIKNMLNEIIITDQEYINRMKKESEDKKNISENDYICSICNSSICISDRGNVYPCAGWQEYVVGDIKTTSLKEIWKNSDKIKYLRNLRRNDFPKCMQCSDKEYCTMCMVRNANENPNGNPLKVNEYYCNVVKLNREIISK